MSKKPKPAAKRTEHVRHFDEAVDSAWTKSRFQAKDKQFLKWHVVQGGKRKDSG